FAPGAVSEEIELRRLNGTTLGLTILILVLARLAYRLAVGKPPYREPLHRFNRVGSSAAHSLLYALMILMPISGYVFTGAAGRSLPFFGLFEWPSFVPKDKVLSQLAGVFHYCGAWIICSVLALHVLAVVWHSWVKKGRGVCPDAWRTASRRSSIVR